MPGQSPAAVTVNGIRISLVHAETVSAANVPTALVLAPLPLLPTGPPHTAAAATPFAGAGSRPGPFAGQIVEVHLPAANGDQCAVEVDLMYAPA